MNITDIDYDTIKKLYQDMDINKDGKVSLDEIAQVLSTYKKSNSTHNSMFNSIYEKMTRSLESNSEKIIKLLKDLKQRATFKEDEKSITDIDW
jgi:hypothetical protein